MKYLVLKGFLLIAGGLFMSAPLAMADNSCLLEISKAPGLSIETSQITAQGYRILGSNERAISLEAVNGQLAALRPGRALFAQWGVAPDQFRLYYRSTDPTHQLLTLDTGSFKKAYGDRLPSCAALKILSSRAVTQRALTGQAQAVIRGESPDGFSWGDFFLSYESTMYFRDGYYVDNEQNNLSYHEALNRWAKIDLSGDFRAGLDRLLTEVMNEFLPAYCISGNTFTSGFLQKCAACQGQTLFLMSVMRDLKITPPEPFVFAVQSFSDHIQPVLWDTKNKRSWNLVSGGGWQSELIAPLFKPEMLIDYALRSPYAPVLDQLNNADALRWLVQDADDGKLTANPFTQILAFANLAKLPSLSLVKPRLYDGGSPREGLLRHLQMATDTPYGTDAPEFAVLKRGNLSDGANLIPNTNNQPEGILGIDLNVAETILDILSFPETLSAEDYAILSPLKDYVSTKYDSNNVKVTVVSSRMSSPKGQAVIKKIYDTYSVNQLLKATGRTEIPQGEACRSRSMPLFLDKAIANLSYFTLDQRAALLPKTLTERTLEFERLAKLDWQKTTLGPIRNLQRFLQSSATEFGLTRGETWRQMSREISEVALGVLALSRRNQVLAYSVAFDEDIYPIDPKCNEVWMTRELRDLLQAVFRHAQTLGLDHRQFLEGAVKWSPEDIEGFERFYSHLFTFMDSNDYGVVSRLIWPQINDVPIETLLDRPLQYITDQILKDPEFEYTVTPSPAEAEQRRQALASEKFISEKQIAAQVQLPVVPLPKDFCANQGGLVQIPNVSIYVDCPASTEASSNEVYLRKQILVPPTLMGTLFGHLSEEYLNHPVSKILVSAVWSERITDPKGLAQFNILKRAMYADSPFLTPLPNGIYQSIDLKDSKICFGGGSGVSDGCREVLHSWQPFDSSGEPIWLTQDPMLRAAYLIWKNKVGSYVYYDTLAFAMNEGYSLVDDRGDLDKTYAFRWKDKFLSVVTPAAEHGFLFSHWSGDNFIAIFPDTLLRWLDF